MEISMHSDDPTPQPPPLEKKGEGAKRKYN